MKATQQCKWNRSPEMHFSTKTFLTPFKRCLAHFKFISQVMQISSIQIQKKKEKKKIINEIQTRKNIEEQSFNLMVHTLRFLLYQSKVIDR